MKNQIKCLMSILAICCLVIGLSSCKGKAFKYGDDVVRAVRTEKKTANQQSTKKQKPPMKFKLPKQRQWAQEKEHEEEHHSTNPYSDYTPAPTYQEVYPQSCNCPNNNNYPYSGYNYNYNQNQALQQMQPIFEEIDRNLYHSQQLLNTYY